MPGPARTPNEIKRKRGTLKASKSGALISIKESLPTVADTAMPVGLGPIAAEVWHRIIAQAGGWIAVSDREALEMLCKAIEFHADLGARIAADGPVLYTDKGYAYPHPAVGMRSTAEDSIRKWMSQLGLTPADRAKLGIAMVESQSKLDKFRERLQQKAGRHAG
jgi:P27 family predicted phage terminase small subunit